MACRVGITTDMEARRRYWESQHPTLQDWQVISLHSTKTAAQGAENRAATRHGCESGEGGDGPEVATWYVYFFTY